MNQCACGLDFGSVDAFDAHRVGTHEYTFDEGVMKDPSVEDGRRCLSLDELVGSPRFGINRRGSWSLTRTLASARGLKYRTAGAQSA